jgi:hypothetical protein
MERRQTNARFYNNGSVHFEDSQNALSNEEPAL